MNLNDCTAIQADITALNRFYVYLLCDPRCANLPFYVGKGTGDRAKVHLIETEAQTDNLRKYRKVQKILAAGLEPVIVYHTEALAEDQAYDIEASLILRYGRIGYDEDGILTNVCVDSRPPSQALFDRHVADALSLVAQFGGIPSGRWLRKNDWVRLDAALRRYPHLFREMHLSCMTRSVAEYVAIAQEIVDRDGCLDWDYLDEQEHIGLCAAMYLYPNEFNHLPQAYINRSLEDYVKFADSVVATNGGVLPNLQRRGYSGLAKTMAAHPSVFAHIKRMPPPKSLEEHRATALRLAAEHGGFLPYEKWLSRCGHEDLAGAIRRRPDLFEDIPKAIGRSGKEHDAARIAGIMLRDDVTHLEYEGKTLPLSAWASLRGMSPEALNGRVKAGWSIEDALNIPIGGDPPTPRGRKIAHEGETKTLVGWAVVTGIPRQVLSGRLQKGWSIERTLTTPLRVKSERAEAGTT